MSNHRDISEAHKNVWMMKTANMFSFPYLCLRVSESDNEPTMEAFLLMERGAGAGCGKHLLGSWLEKRGHCPLLGGQGTWHGQREATGDLGTARDSTAGWFSGGTQKLRVLPAMWEGRAPPELTLPLLSDGTSSPVVPTTHSCQEVANSGFLA